MWKPPLMGPWNSSGCWGPEAIFRTRKNLVSFTNQPRKLQRVIRRGIRPSPLKEFLLKKRNAHAKEIVELLKISKHWPRNIKVSTLWRYHSRPLNKQCHHVHPMGIRVQHHLRGILEHIISGDKNNSTHPTPKHHSNTTRYKIFTKKAPTFCF